MIVTCGLDLNIFSDLHRKKFLNPGNSRLKRSLCLGISWKIVGGLEKFGVSS